jgi:hypothetical protein
VPLAASADSDAPATMATCNECTTFTAVANGRVDESDMLWYCFTCWRQLNGTVEIYPYADAPEGEVASDGEHF